MKSVLSYQRGVSSVDLSDVHAVTPSLETGVRDQQEVTYDSDHTAVRDVGVVRSSNEAGCLDQDRVIQDYEMTTLPDVHATLSSSLSSSSSSMNE